ncbi:MAG: M23 family metallopeptidase [Thermodesulfobacteriota bacterium]
MKTKEKKSMIRFVIPLLGILMLGVFAYTYIKMEKEIPALSLTPEFTSMGLRRDFTVSVSDHRSGLKSVKAVLIKDDKELLLFEEKFSASGFFSKGNLSGKSYPIGIETKRLGFSDGKATLKVSARDHSWRNWFNGNLGELEREFVVDTRPPQLTVFSKFHYLNQGGTGLVVYKLSEPCPRSGVRVGDHFFPGYSGYFQDPLMHLAFFALDHQQGPGTKIHIEAMDAAENSIRGGFPHQIKARVFKKDTLSISDEFLHAKMPEFQGDLGKDATGTPLDQFLKVNRTLREQNYRQVIDICRNSESKRYWEGVFLRLPNAGPQAGFADQRDYSYQGKIIDRQFHLGLDLASLERSMVPAANRGKVIFSNRLGIYGNTVILDHGYGVFSMYSHLSQFDVNAGQVVERGDIVGRTGVSGLAGGDHLHFSIIIQSVFVHPVEWWDPLWIEKRIEAKLKGTESE